MPTLLDVLTGNRETLAEELWRKCGGPGSRRPGPCPGPKKPEPMDVDPATLQQHPMDVDPATLDAARSGTNDPSGKAQEMYDAIMHDFSPEKLKEEMNKELEKMAADPQKWIYDAVNNQQPLHNTMFWDTVAIAGPAYAAIGSHPLNQTHDGLNGFLNDAVTAKTGDQGYWMQDFAGTGQDKKYFAKVKAIKGHIFKVYDGLWLALGKPFNKMVEGSYKTPLSGIPAPGKVPKALANAKALVEKGVQSWAKTLNSKKFSSLVKGIL